MNFRYPEGMSGRQQAMLVWNSWERTPLALEIDICKASFNVVYLDEITLRKSVDIAEKKS